MTRLRAVLVLTLAAAVAGSGCLLKRSPASRVYVLAPVEVSGAASPGAVVAVAGVAKVSVPDWLDRPHLITQAAGGEIVADEFSRWGEPLNRGIQRVLAENLAALLPDRRVALAPFEPRLTVDHRVEVTVLDATRQTDGTVLVEARWDIVGESGAAFVRRRFSHRALPGMAGATGLVTGINEALGVLCRDIAGALRALPPAKD